MEFVTQSNCKSSSALNKFSSEKQSRMEDENIHTSVVIELANPKGESEKKKLYQTEIEEENVPKDYVIDQIFCGENVTVYALFEVPENENRNLEKNFLEVSSSNFGNDNTFYYKNSFKSIKNEKKLNGFTQNSSRMSSEENLKFFSDTNSRNRSLYCLKHPSRDYDLLTPERKKSDLKILYSKHFSLEKSKTTKFKAISVGVNTDIVQSPGIIEEVQKVLGVNVPLLKFKEKILENMNSSSMASYDLTEVGTRPSCSSLTSSVENKNCARKSVSNLFLVPLLMMEDDNINRFSKDDNSQRTPKKARLLDNKNFISKVSLGVNTDESEFDSSYELNRKRRQITSSTVQLENSSSTYQLQEIQQEDKNTGRKLKVNERETILKEIKTMQIKLSALIKNIESSDFESDTQDYNKTDSNSNLCHQTAGNLENNEIISQNKLELMPKDEEIKVVDQSQKNLDDRPILLPQTYPSYNKIEISDLKGKTQDSVKEEEIKDEMHVNIIKSTISNASALPDENLLLSGMDERFELKKTSSCYKISCKSFENPRSLFLSKSESNLRYNVKQNNLKKSLSSDFRNNKIEIFKNINYPFKQEGSFKMNMNGRIVQNNEVHSGDNESLVKFEVGDDANKKLSSKIILVNVFQENEKEKIPSLSEIDSYVNKNYNDEEGDAKFRSSKEKELTITFDEAVEKPQVTFLETNVTTSDVSLNPEKSLNSCKKESKPLDKTTEVEKKSCNDSEKPSTPNGSSRKIINTHTNTKKESKLIKQTINRPKVAETNIKIESPTKKILNRKSNKMNAESKLHINKLLKLNDFSHQKVSHLTKFNNDEKKLAKGDQNYRSNLQKQDRIEDSMEILNESNNEAKSKYSKKKFFSSIQVDLSNKKNCTPKAKAVEMVGGIENIEEPASNLTSQKQKPPSADSSSVVVKLLSKKPTSIKDLYPGLSQEFRNSENLQKIPNEARAAVGNTETEEQTKLNEENAEKSIVKSVWALTKVLLFEDGTKKLEVLEASLTPPEYSLNKTVKIPK